MAEALVGDPSVMPITSTSRRLTTAIRVMTWLCFVLPNEI